MAAFEALHQFYLLNIVVISSNLTIENNGVQMVAKENANPRKAGFKPIFEVNIPPLFRQHKTALFRKRRYCVVFSTEKCIPILIQLEVRFLLHFTFYIGYALFLLLFSASTILLKLGYICKTKVFHKYY